MNRDIHFISERLRSNINYTQKMELLSFFLISSIIVVDFSSQDRNNRDVIFMFKKSKMSAFAPFHKSTLGHDILPCNRPNERNEVANFFLYTRKNPLKEQIIKVHDFESLKLSNFNASTHVKFLVHGWMNNGSAGFLKNFTKSYLKAYDCNVIVVDWGLKSESLLYPVSAYWTVCVGRYVADMIEFLSSSFELPLDNVHILGHSLGAHVAGYAGKNVKKGKIARITGLDPARPLFRAGRSKNKLQPEDAKFVDVVHTCAPYLGFRQPLGHVDFYPNGGEYVQPGCKLERVEKFGSCSHKRSYEYYMESITGSVPFYAIKCLNWREFTNGKCSNGQSIEMGEKLVERYGTSIRGIFYLATNPTYPYSIGNQSKSKQIGEWCERNHPKIENMPLP